MLLFEHAVALLVGLVAKCGQYMYKAISVIYVLRHPTPCSKCQSLWNSFSIMRALSRTAVRPRDGNLYCYPGRVAYISKVTQPIILVY